MTASSFSGLCGGVETEYAVAAFDRKARRIQAPRVSAALVQLAGRLYPNLPSGQDQGVHLENGGKIYRERGAAADYGLPEFATAESGDPVELVRQVEGGHLLLETLCSRLGEVLPEVSHAEAYRHGTCHVNGTSWATHFNALTTSSLANLAKHLVPFLASKVIFGGAGGFALGDRKFSVAPRCATIESVQSGTTTHNRGLLDSRQLSHCPPAYGRRQHLVVFENLCSHIGRYTDLAATFLVTALVDGGIAVGKGVLPEDPVGAIRTFAADPTCRATVRVGRRHLTAIEIQRHFLDAVREAVSKGKPALPDWATDCCDRWARLLEAIAAGAPESVADCLDWACKWMLFQQMPGGRLEDKLELDIRFGQLGKEGVFRQLDEAGLLHHRVPGIDRIPEALCTPPSDTRAKPRGIAISAMHREGRPGKAYWDRIADLSMPSRSLDLSDPFQIEPDWKSA